VSFSHAGVSFYHEGVSFFHAGVGWILRECLDFFEKFSAVAAARKIRCGIAAWILRRCGMTARRKRCQIATRKSSTDCSTY